MLLLLRPRLLSQGAWACLREDKTTDSNERSPLQCSLRPSCLQRTVLPWGTLDHSGETVGFAVESLWAEVRDVGSASYNG